MTMLFICPCKECIEKRSKIHLKHYQTYYNNIHELANSKKFNQYPPISHDVLMEDNTFTVKFENDEDKNGNIFIINTNTTTITTTATTSNHNNDKSRKMKTQPRYIGCYKSKADLQKHLRNKYLNQLNSLEVHDDDDDDNDDNKEKRNYSGHKNLHLQCPFESCSEKFCFRKDPNIINSNNKKSKQYFAKEEPFKSTFSAIFDHIITNHVGSICLIRKRKYISTTSLDELSISFSMEEKLNSYGIQSVYENLIKLEDMQDEAYLPSPPPPPSSKIKNIIIENDPFIEYEILLHFINSKLLNLCCTCKKPFHTRSHLSNHHKICPPLPLFPKLNYDKKCSGGDYDDENNDGSNDIHHENYKTEKLYSK